MSTTTEAEGDAIVIEIESENLDRAIERKALVLEPEGARSLARALLTALARAGHLDDE